MRRRLSTHGRAVDVDAELRELQRDVALDAGRDDDVDEPEVLARGGVGFLERADALAEVVERQQHAARLERARAADGFLDRLAGDEAAREAVRRSPCRSVDASRLSVSLRDRA